MIGNGDEQTGKADAMLFDGWGFVPLRSGGAAGRTMVHLENDTMKSKATERPPQHSTDR